MIIKRERGQERTNERTVGKREPGTRPRVKKSDSAPADQGRRGRTEDRRLETGKGDGKRIGKSKVIKTKSGSGISAAVGTRGFKERTSDVFRRNVIEKKGPRKFEGAESDQFLTKEGKVLRGKFGKQNLHKEVTIAEKPTKSNVPGLHYINPSMSPYYRLN